MKTGTEANGEVLSIELFGSKFELEISEVTLKKCEDIKKRALTKLEEIKASNEKCKNCDGEVCEFLKESIEILLGNGTVDIMFSRKNPSIAELTGALCYIISETGAVMLKNTDGEEVEK